MRRDQTTPALDTRRATITSGQQRRLFVIARDRGMDLDQLREAIGGSISRLSAAQASEHIERLSGEPLPNPPGQAPKRKAAPAEGVTRMITPEHIEQIERLLKEAFANRDAGMAWLSKDFKVDQIRGLATAERAGQVIRVLKEITARSKRDRLRSQ